MFCDLIKETIIVFAPFSLFVCHHHDSKLAKQSKQAAATRVEMEDGDGN